MARPKPTLSDADKRTIVTMWQDDRASLKSIRARFPRLSVAAIARVVCQELGVSKLPDRELLTAHRGTAPLAVSAYNRRRRFQNA